MAEIVKMIIQKLKFGTLFFSIIYNLFVNIECILMCNVLSVLSFELLLNYYYY